MGGIKGVLLSSRKCRRGAMRIFRAIAANAALFVGAALAQPALTLTAAAVLVGTWALSWTVKG